MGPLLDLEFLPVPRLVSPQLFFEPLPIGPALFLEFFQPFLIDPTWGLHFQQYLGHNESGVHSGHSPVILPNEQ